jgi:dihydroorotase
LRIVLEHATSAAAVEAVKQCGSTVACTITVHHLALTVDAWAGQPLNFCKPVAKLASDRDALRKVIAEGNEKFFLGSDSAPHTLRKKLPSAHDHVHAQLSASKSEAGPSECPSCAAGIYSSSALIPLVAELFEDDSLGTRIPLERLEAYVSTFGRKFYQEAVRESEKEVVLRRSETKSRVAQAYSFVAEDGQQEYVQPFYGGKEIGWEVVQK